MKKTEIIDFPSTVELHRALDVFDKGHKNVNPYGWESVGLRIKQIVFIDWTKNKLEFVAK